MSSTPNSSCRTRRSYTFSIGDSPRANIRIASFIDHAWGIGNTVNQSLCTLESGNQDLSRKSCEHMEQEKQKFPEYREHHRRASSATFPHFSINTNENEDIISDYLDSEAPCIETARLQFHQAVPVRRLIYTSRSHATSNFSGESVSLSQISRYSNEWTKELKSLFESTWNRSCKPYNTPSLSHTLHTTLTQITKVPSPYPIGGHDISSPPKTPSKPKESDSQILVDQATSLGFDIAYRRRFNTRRADLWPCQYSPARANRIRAVSDHVAKDHNSVELLRSKDSSQLWNSTLPEVSRMSSTSAVLFHLPFTPSRVSRIDPHHKTTNDYSDRKSYPGNSDAEWVPCSADDTLMEDDFVSDDQKDLTRGGRDTRPSIKTHLRKMLRKFHSAGRWCW